MDMIPKPGTRLSLHLFLAAALFAVGCSDGGVVGPNNQPEVSNNTDTFQWQVSKLSGVTQTFTYNWSNTGALVNVDQSSTLSGGSAILTVKDAAGSEVYSANLTDNGSFQSSSGAAGDWTVTVVLTNATGTLNFRLQKP